MDIVAVAFVAVIAFGITACLGCCWVNGTQGFAGSSTSHQFTWTQFFRHSHAYAATHKSCVWARAGMRGSDRVNTGERKWSVICRARMWHVECLAMTHNTRLPLHSPNLCALYCNWQSAANAIANATANAIYFPLFALHFHYFHPQGKTTR